MATTTQSVSANTVALRGLASTSAISPKISDGPRRSTMLPFTSTATVPSRTTKSSAPGSPARKIASPAL
jgi:hypothetical protein